MNRGITILDWADASCVVIGGFPLGNTPHFVVCGYLGSRAKLTLTNEWLLSLLIMVPIMLLQLIIRIFASLLQYIVYTLEFVKTIYWLFVKIVITLSGVGHQLVMCLSVVLTYMLGNTSLLMIGGVVYKLCYLGGFWDRIVVQALDDLGLLFHFCRIIWHSSQFNSI